MRQKQGLYYSKWQEEGRRSAQGWNRLSLTTNKPGSVGVISTSPFFNPRIAQSHACVTHMVQDSSVSHECDIQGVLRLHRPNPETPSPSAAIYRPLSARFAPGPSCLLQLGSHQRRDNKQVHWTGPCARAGADVSETPVMLTVLPHLQRPGGKTRFSLSILEPPGCRDTPQA